MTDNELLTKVKDGLGITGNFTDNTIKIYIGEVKQALIAAGVKRSVVESEKSVGCILIGVNDLWNYSAGGTKFSDYFEKRAIQLAAEG
jgi:predicted metal-dependent peptidase